MRAALLILQESRRGSALVRPEVKEERAGPGLAGCRSRVSVCLTGGGGGGLLTVRL